MVNLMEKMAKADKKICHEEKRVCEHGANKNVRFKSLEEAGIVHCTLREDGILKTKIQRESDQGF